VAKEVTIPIIAAGGIGTGAGILAALTLGADGVQIGSRFVPTHESSAHINFKNAVIASKEGDTLLTLKELTPVRLLKNEFFNKVQASYANGTNVEELTTLLGRGRAKKGMFEGDLIEGELEIGQVAGLFEKLQSAKEVMEELIQGYHEALKEKTTEKYNF